MNQKGAACPHQKWQFNGRIPDVLYIICCHYYILYRIESRFQIDRCDFLLSVESTISKVAFFSKDELQEIETGLNFFLAPVVVVVVVIGQQRPFNPRGFIVQFSFYTVVEFLNNT